LLRGMEGRLSPGTARRTRSAVPEHGDPSPGGIWTPVRREVGQHWGMSRLKSRHFKPVSLLRAGVARLTHLSRPRTPAPAFFGDCDRLSAPAGRRFARPAAGNSPEFAWNSRTERVPPRAPPAWHSGCPFCRALRPFPRFHPALEAGMRKAIPIL